MNCPHCNTPNPDDARFCASCGKATSATEPVSNPGLRPMPDPIGKEIAGRYRIVSKLGEGGMGAVYKAEQISLKRTCAVKVLRPDVAGTAIMLRRFNAEAENVAKLSHPNIVNVYDFGQDTDGTFFIAMEYVEGKSLREVIHAEAPLSHRRAVAIAMQVATSLVEAHSHQIIHRDLKPDNVMLQNRGRAKDVVRVLDFGIAKLRDEGRATQAAMTQAGDMLGTPQYMAPEQIRAEQIDGRTDIYALGCMLYEMITARLPFEAPTLMALLSKHLMEQPPRPSQRRPELMIPPFLDDVIMEALAKDPNARPVTMEAYGEKLAHAMSMLPPDTTASAPQSAVVPAMSAPMGVVTPPPAHQAFTPPPQHYPPPPGYPTPAPPPHYPPPPGYGTPQAAYSPYAQVPQTQAIGGPPKKSGFPVIAIVLIAVLAVGGAGAGIYLATRPSDNELVAKTDDAGAGEAKTIDAAVEDDVPTVDAAAKVDPPEDPDPDDPPEDPDDPDDKDPWSGAGEMVTKMAEFKKRACLCLDASCAQKVTGDMGKWNLDFSKRFDSSAMDAATMTKVSELGAEFAECVRKASSLTIKKPDPNPPASLNAQLDGLANRACGCKDVGCARRVLNEFSAFVRRNKNAPGGDAKRAEASGRRLGMCLITAGMDSDELMRVLNSI